jgi:small conductance mechanosensitive channel
MGASTFLDATCSRDDPTLCGWVYDVTGSRRLGEAAQVFVGTPLRIILILLVGLLVRWVLHRIIDRAADGIAAGSSLGRKAARAAEDANTKTVVGRAAAVTARTLNGIADTRRAQRARTLASVLKSITTMAIGTVAVLTIMGDLGYPLGPLLTSAGIVGVALGFGAQTLVKDFISGVFMLLEDQYGVGDVVDLGEASGTVESVGLRVTRLRDVEGTVWYVRNGEILRVGNRSQGWARAVLDVTVAYGENVEQVKRLLLEEAEATKADPAFGALILEAPEVWGVEALSTEGIVVRLVAKTQPLEQWKIARELRLRITARFEREGVRVPLPQQAMFVHDSTPPMTANAASAPADHPADHPADQDPPADAPVPPPTPPATRPPTDHPAEEKRERRPLTED